MLQGFYQIKIEVNGQTGCAFGTFAKGKVMGGDSSYLMTGDFIWNTDGHVGLKIDVSKKCKGVSVLGTEPSGRLNLESLDGVKFTGQFITKYLDLPIMIKLVKLSEI